MANFDSSDSNILDAETMNWRLIVYPILAVLVFLMGGFAYYFYQISQREQVEIDARAALVQAKTPEEMLKVADQYPNTDQATLALIGAAELSFGKRDYDGAAKDYQRVVSNDASDASLRDSAQVGIAACLEASGKIDDAIAAYLVIARLGGKNFYAPYAYSTVARLYDQRGDKDDELKILAEAGGLDPSSPFIQNMQRKLTELTPSPAPFTPPAPVPVPGAGANAPVIPAGQTAPPPTAVPSPEPVKTPTPTAPSGH